jgi:hypothetical protein
LPDNELIRTKLAFVQLTAFPGWEYLRQTAEMTIVALERKALSEDDRDKREQFIHDARGARKFWEVLTGAIDRTKAASTETEDIHDEFYAVVSDGAEKTA